MGTLGGIGELAREVFGGDEAPKPPQRPKPNVTARVGPTPGVPGAPRIEG